KRGHIMTNHFQNKSTIALALLCIVPIMACGGEITGPVTESNEPMQSGVGMTLHNNGDVVTVEITGDIISNVDFFLNESTSAFARDSTSPYAATLSTAGLPAGEHYVRALIEINVMGDSSTITRTKTFSLSDDGSTEPVASEFPLVAEL